MALVYRHRRLSDNSVFYIGISKTNKRPYSKSSRNKHWKNIASKHGFYVEIMCDNISWEDACEIEELIIKEYGRIDLGTGCLVNMTDGGEGNKNMAESTKNAIIKANKGKKQTCEHVKNMHNGIKHKKKIVQQFNLNGVLLNEFLGIRYASRELGISYRQLQRVIRGERRQTRGFIFKIKD